MKATLAILLAIFLLDACSRPSAPVTNAPAGAGHGLPNAEAAQ